MGEQGLLKFIKDAFERPPEELPVPDLRTDRNAWYTRWDEDSSGELEFEEVLRAFAKSFSISVEGIGQLRESLTAVWPIFDVDGSGAVDKQEFMIPRDGLADTVLATMSMR